MDRIDRKRRPALELMEGRLAPSSIVPGGGPPSEVRHDADDNDKNDDKDNDKVDNDANDNDKVDNDKDKGKDKDND